MAGDELLIVLMSQVDPPCPAESVSFDGDVLRAFKSPSKEFIGIDRPPT